MPFIRPRLRGLSPSHSGLGALIALLLCRIWFKLDLVDFECRRKETRANLCNDAATAKQDSSKQRCRVLHSINGNEVACVLALNKGKQRWDVGIHCECDFSLLLSAG